MADFCRTCTEDDGLPGGDYENGTGDLQNLVESEQRHTHVARVICEGCGPTEVDIKGNCMGNCLNKDHGRRELIED